MNVTELARRMKIPTSKLLEKLPEWGFDIGKRAIKIDDRQANRILRLWRDGEISTDETGPKQEKLKVSAEHAQEVGPIILPQRITVSTFAARMRLPVTSVIRELMKNGVMATLNQDIDYETAAIIAEDLGFVVKRDTDTATEVVHAGKDIKEMVKEEGDHMVRRPPIVVVMGHVDHGKTKLLDAIRKTNVMGGESGGITQHIGAYQIEKNGKMLTFLDTPGHEAFRAMRARGGRAADIAILVVAANDGVQPQTREAVQIIQQEKLPFIVAINKIDVADANVESVKRELAEMNMLPEDWGGKTICVPVSAKAGQGIDMLIETLLLVADMEGFKANPNRDAIGTIVESHLDAGEGHVATVLVHTGTLRGGDLVVVGDITGKVRMLKNYRGEVVEEATPGMPVRILGLKGVPEVGDVLEVTRDKELVRNKEKAKKSTSKKERVDLGSLTTVVSEDEQEGIKKIKLILKCDVLGSEEAIIESLAVIHNPEVGVQILGRGLGNITEADVIHAESAGAEILAFRVLIPRAVADLASTKKVMIRKFEIIYDLLDHVRAELEALLTPEILRTEYGTAKVLAVFREEAKYTIFGGVVTQGKMVKGARVAIIHEETERGSGVLEELQQNKIAVNETTQGAECGMRFVGKARIHEGDTLTCYTEDVRKKKL